MDIKIYGSEKCGKCKIIKDKLEKKGVEFYYTDDVEETLEMADKVGRRDLPISIVDGKFVDYIGMVKLIREMKNG